MLAWRQPVAFDLRAILGALKIAHNLERMGDYAKNMAKRASALAQLQAVGPVNGISRMGRLTHVIIKEVLDAYAEPNVDTAVSAWNQIGRASCRERVWQDVYISVGAVR